ncbi:MAG: hypothetical protein JSV79_06600 [Armatimonadota bacterium]|nr:MAG: hypothetical protein JSV79_06600 [Armatimonadota bacterium]
MSEASAAAALSGPEKAAVLLLSFSSEKSAGLISRLTPREAEVLADQLARVREIDPATRRRVLEEFKQAADRAAPQQPRPDPDPHPARPLALDGASGGEPAEGAGDNSLRPYDFTGLDRLPRPSLTGGAELTGRDLLRLGDLLIRCRAQLAAPPLALADLRHLTPGHVLLLGPASEDGVRLVAGDHCHLPARLLRRGQHRAIELLPGSSTGEDQ